MGILTNFLKLLKPEPNDFVDVAKHISENYDKLDQNAKSNNETLTNLSNNKLDKGTYPGDAGTLKTEIDGKVSKSGDTMTGALTVKAAENDTNTSTIIYNNGGIDLKREGSNALLRVYNGTKSGYFGRIFSDNSITLGNDVTGASYKILDNGYHKVTLASSTGEFIIDGGANPKDAMVRITTANTNYAPVIRFVNTARGTDKTFFAEVTNNNGFRFANSVSSEFPSRFSFSNNTGTIQSVDILTLNSSVNFISTNYLNKQNGGTIGASIHVVGAISCSGSLTAAGNVTAYSDIKLKKDISPLENCLNLINKLDIYRYKWKETENRDIGVIAQEVEKVFPEFVVEIQDAAKGKIKTVDYSKLATVSLGGIKELFNIVQDLQREVKSLKEDINNDIT